MALETAPAFQFYVKEWRSSRPVMRMTFAQRGMYLEMLLEQWESLTLPDSAEAVADIIGGDVAEWVAAWPILRRNFLRDEATGRITNTRLERCRKDRRQYEKWSRKNARKGGIARSSSAKRREDGTYYPAQSPAESTSDIQPASSLANQPTPASASASSSASAPAERARPRPTASIHTTHKRHVVCGKVCLHETQFDSFVRRRNGDREPVRAWAAAVCDEWTAGVHREDEPGDEFDFWRARYDERWPASAAAQAKAPVRDTGPIYRKATGTDGRQ